MLPSEYDATPREVRGFAALQVVITAVLVVVLFVVLGGIDAPRPPWPAIAVLLAIVVAAAVVAERVWTRTPALDPTTSGEDQRRRGVAIFAAQTVRRLAVCQVPVVAAVATTFVAPWGGWPLVVAAVPGVVVLAWATTPTLRSTSLTEALLDADGAESGLVAAFREG